MKLLWKLVGSLLLWVTVAAVLVLLVLLPRDTQSHRDGYKDIMSYKFTWTAYKENIVNYWEGVKEHKSLGITRYELPVEEELVHFGWRSAKILIPALFLSVLAGVYKGMFDYRRQTGLWRFFGKRMTWLGQAVPEFILIIFIQTIVFEAGKRGFLEIDIYGDEKLENLFLPILFLSMYPAAIIARYTAAALEEEDSQDYIKTARSKGIGEKAVLWHHAMRNSWPKLLQQSMPIFMTLLSGMFIVEFMSIYNGIGYRLVVALQLKGVISPGQSLPIETPAVIGFSLLFMALLLIVQWIVAILEYVLVPVKRGDGS
ncbi:ABC transporter permease subunit [Peribacillus sp. SCS-155]|uniref:ABC transporter permease subunit n=1 Tax=Peribacillus sedimenti TaxID=3115297 RepID=UPI003905928A